MCGCGLVGGASAWCRLICKATTRTSSVCSLSTNDGTRCGCGLSTNDGTSCGCGYHTRCSECGLSADDETSCGCGTRHYSRCL